MKTCKGLSVISALVLLTGSALPHHNPQIPGPRIAVRFQRALSTNEEVKIKSHLHHIESFTALAHYTSPYFASWKLAQFSADIDLDAAITQLRQMPLVTKVEVIGAATVASVEIPPSVVPSSNDPFSGYQWGLSNQGQILRKDIDDIHSINS